LQAEIYFSLRLRHFLLFFWLIAGFNLCAQTSKNYMKAASQFLLNGYYQEAIEQYSLAITLEPENGKAFEERAKSYEKTGNLPEAANDYRNAAVLGITPPENFFKAAQLYYNAKQYHDALPLTVKSVELQPRFYEAYVLQSQVCIEIADYVLGLLAAEKAIGIKNTAYAYYLKGTCAAELGNLVQAEQDLEKAIIKDKMLMEAFLQLAKVQLKNNKINYAIENCSYLLKFDKNNTGALELRSRAYFIIKDYPKSIEDISRVIVLDSVNSAHYVLRGRYYSDFNQFNNAISDFSHALKLDMLNNEALKYRAGAYENIGNKTQAASDLSLLLTLIENDETEDISQIENKIFELNREEVRPKINLLNPKINDKLEVLIPSDAETIKFVIRIEDASNLQLVKINNDTLLDNPTGSRKKDFEIIMDSEQIEYLTITASDVYDNIITESFPVEHIETHAPKLLIHNPYVGDNNIIVVNQDDKYLYLEGRVEDESPIKSIFIDDITASYPPANVNPRFTATLDISGKTGLKIRVTDVHGNNLEKNYILKHDGITVSDDSPMGKTWAVLIDNSEYREFTNLNSPSKDIQLMQQALERYQISKVIVKKNMTKREMERFFSIDLRDLVRINEVNSLFIWYAGHGMNLEGTGYWIPSDAKLNVEFSYFSVNALKASLYSYTSLTHLLIVSDACQTGTGFCTAMRGPLEVTNCNNIHLLNKKSAQVLTSAGSGYAYDNSLFTRSFANSLLNNEDDCSTIEAIVNRISVIMLQTSTQKPEFGRINGIEDHAGTFFFISR